MTGTRTVGGTRPRVRPQLEVLGEGEVERLLAQLALAAAGFGLLATTTLSTTLLVLLFLLPVVVSGLRRAALVWAWVAVLVAAGIDGYVLRTSTLGSFGAGASNLAWGQVDVLFTGGAVLLLVAWARTVLPTWRVGVAYGVGLLASAATTGAAFGPTGYKFYFALPAALIGLGLADRLDRKLVTAATAVALGLVGILDDARSYMGYCVLTALLLIWLAMRGSGRSAMNRWAPAVLIAIGGGAIYAVTSQALTHGLLGAKLQTLSTTQVDAAGSLIVGGRPEWAATLQLMKVHPSGYGPDVLPKWAEIVQAKQGLQAVGLNVVDNGYVDNYMFGGSLNLHSVVADLWAEFGVLGLLLGLGSFVLVVANLSRGLADRSIGGVGIFSGLTALWVLAFGPIYTNWRDVCFALGLLLPLRLVQSAAEDNGGRFGAFRQHRGAHDS